MPPILGGGTKLHKAGQIDRASRRQRLADIGARLVSGQARTLTPAAAGTATSRLEGLQGLASRL